VRARLIRHARILIPYFVRYDVERGQATREPFESVSEFIHLLGQTDLWPATQVIPGSFGGEDEAENERRATRLRTVGETLAIHLAELRNLPSIRRSLDANQLIRQLSLFTELLRISDWSSIDLRWAKGLREQGFEPGWRACFNADFDRTVTVMSGLLRALDELDRIRM
jgi:hypothetical protein